MSHVTLAIILNILPSHCIAKCTFNSNHFIRISFHCTDCSCVFSTSWRAAERGLMLSALAKLRSHATIFLSIHFDCIIHWGIKSCTGVPQAPVQFQINRRLGSVLLQFPAPHLLHHLHKFEVSLDDWPRTYFLLNQPPPTAEV